jgi:hypothetical protein
VSGKLQFAEEYVGVLAALDGAAKQAIHINLKTMVFDFGGITLNWIQFSLIHIPQKKSSHRIGRQITM